MVFGDLEYLPQGRFHIKINIQIEQNYMVLFPQSINLYFHKVKSTDTLGLCPRGHRQIGAVRLQAGCQYYIIVEKGVVSLVKSFDSACEQDHGKV